MSLASWWDINPNWTQISLESLIIVLTINLYSQDGKSGRTILDYVTELGNVSLLKFLLQYRSLVINASTYGGQSPLMLAKGRRHNLVVKILKSARAQYDSSDESIEDEEMVCIFFFFKF